MKKVTFHTKTLTHTHSICDINRWQKATELKSNKTKMWIKHIQRDCIEINVRKSIFLQLHRKCHLISSSWFDLVRLYSNIIWYNRIGSESSATASVNRSPHWRFLWHSFKPLESTRERERNLGEPDQAREINRVKVGGEESTGTIVTGAQRLKIEWHRSSVAVLKCNYIFRILWYIHKCINGCVDCMQL